MISGSDSRILSTLKISSNLEDFFQNRGSIQLMASAELHAAFDIRALLHAAIDKVWERLEMPNCPSGWQCLIASLPHCIDSLPRCVWLLLLLLLLAMAYFPCGWQWLTGLCFGTQHPTINSTGWIKGRLADKGGCLPVLNLYWAPSLMIHWSICWKIDQITSWIWSPSKV